MVAKEARIFSLLTLGGGPSPHLEALYKCLEESNHEYEVKTVDYAFQRGGNQILSIW